MKQAVLAVFAMLGLQLANAVGAESQRVGTTYKTATVLKNLNNPWGLAVRAMRSSPGTYEIYFAESGSGRIMRHWTKQGQVPVTFVDGFETGPLRVDSPWQVGPLGVEWVATSKLAVTTASAKLVRIYTLPLHSNPLGAEEFEHVAEPSPATQRLGNDGLTDISANTYLAYFTINTKSPSQGILRTEIRGNRLKRVSPFLSESSSTPAAFAAGVAITPSSRPEFVVVARQLVDGSGSGSRLSFLDPISGSEALDMEVPLTNLAALAYSPSGNLYAVDVAWEDPKQGGVYRLEDARQDGRQYCRTVKIADVARPVDLEFADRRTLYVTALGKEINQNKGSLIEITGNF